MKDPHSTSRTSVYALKVVLAIMWAIPWVAVAIFLIATVVGIPVGALFIVIGCTPWAYIEKKRIDERIAWHYRDRGYAEEYEEEVPWEL